MELIDFDGLFDEKLTVYMEEKKGKYTERQWEDVIPRLYKKFGDTYVAKVGCTPKEYYARRSDTELVETLSAHLSQDVPAARVVFDSGAPVTLVPCLGVASHLLTTVAELEKELFYNDLAWKLK